MSHESHGGDGQGQQGDDGGGRKDEEGGEGRRGGGGGEEEQEGGPLSEEYLLSLQGENMIRGLKTASYVVFKKNVPLPPPPSIERYRSKIKAFLDYH